MTARSSSRRETQAALSADLLSGPSISIGDYELLDGSVLPLVRQVGDGSVVKRFDKTPPPIQKTDVVCPHFLELKWAYGCPFDCAWCYLKGTFRFHRTKTRPIVKDYAKTELHVRRFLSRADSPEVLNTGEIADSLMAEARSNPFSKFIVAMFEEQSVHKVLFVTKSDHIGNLLQIASHNQAIISFSLNAEEVASKWESCAPSVERRIQAARKLSEAGYEVRIRIDPMVPIPGWERHYRTLVDQVFDNFVPSRITLGSLRGLQSTINGSTDRTWVDYLTEGSNWGKKVDFATRREMYANVISLLKDGHGYVAASLCKETVAMWESLHMDFRRIHCNCVW